MIERRETDGKHQHRFIESAVGSATAGKPAEMAKAFGVGGASDQIMDHLKAYVSDYLHPFWVQMVSKDLFKQSR